jgi:phosphorylcholine metabolism protein LicD
MPHTTIVQLDKADKLYWMHRLNRFPELTDKMLTDFDDICQNLNITFFLHAGTALGFYRDHGYTVTALDLDVGLKINDISVKHKIREGSHSLNKALVLKGFIRGSEHYLRNIHYYRDGLCLDMHYMFEPWNTPFFITFDKIEYKGYVYNLPHPIIEYLTEMYGADWHIPNDWGIPLLCPSCRRNMK